jgi:hypothetical protein
MKRALHATTGVTHASWSDFSKWQASRDAGSELPNLYHLCAAYFVHAKTQSVAGTPPQLRFTWRLA